MRVNSDGWCMYREQPLGERYNISNSECRVGVEKVVYVLRVWNGMHCHDDVTSRSLVSGQDHYSATKR